MSIICGEMATGNSGEAGSADAMLTEDRWPNSWKQDDIMVMEVTVVFARVPDLKQYRHAYS